MAESLEAPVRIDPADAFAVKLKNARDPNLRFQIVLQALINVVAHELRKEMLKT